MKRPARAESGMASMKRPARRPARSEVKDTDSTVSYTEAVDEPELEEEEEPCESDVVISPKAKAPSRLKKPAVFFGADEAASPVSKKPAALPVKAPPPDDVEAKEHLKSESEKAQGLISEKHYDDGWREMVYQTPKGRNYVKIVSPAGKSFYSKKSAREAGFKG